MPPKLIAEPALEPLLTPPEVARIIRVSKSEMHRMIHDGVFGVVNVARTGSKLAARIPESEVRRYLTEHTIPARTA